MACGFRKAARLLVAALITAVIASGGGIARAAGPITEYPVPSGASALDSIASDPATGNMYFGAFDTNNKPAIGQITPAGVITFFPLALSSGFPDNGVAVLDKGLDKEVWFAVTNASEVGYLQINGDGTTSENYFPGHFAYGLWADQGGGKVYFAGGSDHIGVMPWQGGVSECILPGSGHIPVEVVGVLGTNDLFFTDQGTHQIGHITNAIIDGAGCVGAVWHSPPTANSGPNGITIGGDGNVWFTELSAPGVASMTTGGSFHEYPAGSSPTEIATGKDGNLYFTDRVASTVSKITTSGTITPFSTPSASARPFGIALGNDGALWFTELAGRIGKLVPPGVPTKTTLSTAATPAVFGQAGSITARVRTIPAGAIPTGSVQFYLNGSPSLVEPLSSTGRARLPLASIDAGSYTVTADYLGDVGFLPSSGGPLSQQIDPANTTVTLTSSANPSPVGGPGHITARVAAVAPGGGVPTGSVTFTVDGVARAPRALSNGRAHIALSSLSLGTHTITASYSGSIDHNPSTSSPFFQMIT